MKKIYISIGLALLGVMLFFSCATAPELKKYPPKSVVERSVDKKPLLVETAWLAEKNNFPNIRIIEYGRKLQDYQKGHIAGAVFIDRKTVWNKVDGIQGMLPPIDTIVPEMEKAGISNDNVVVIYDNGEGLWASRLFWALEYLGHRDVHILNGGWNKWVQEKRAVQMASHVPTRGQFIPHVQHDLLATKDWLLMNLSNPDVKIIDARSPKEYAGEDVRAARGGHIPGSVNINWVSHLETDDSKTFLPKKELRRLYESINIYKNSAVVTLCQSGVRGAHTYFVLRFLEYPRVRLYDGSWAEWGNDWEAPLINEVIDSPK